MAACTLSESLPPHHCGRTWRVLPGAKDTLPTPKKICA